MTARFLPGERAVFSFFPLFILSSAYPTTPHNPITIHKRLYQFNKTAIGTKNNIILRHNLDLRKEAGKAKAAYAIR